MSELTMTDVVIENIYRAVRKQGLKLGEVEVACGVSPGYLSRCRRRKVFLTVDGVARFANKLNVNLFEVHPTSRWIRVDPDRKKSYVYKCPECLETCYCIGSECTYKFCPRCGEKVNR